MLQRSHVVIRHLFLLDILIGLGLGTLIYGLILFAGEWQSTFNPSYQIDLSTSALPLYALFSAMRGLGAYVVSLVFTIAIGYWAAKSKAAEKIIIPLLDILQSIPVLGFLPGLVLGLVAIFPHSNVGLELAAILMIFTGQVWNMTFAFYSSLKSVPGDLQEATAVMGLSDSTRLMRLELPFSAVNLVWNSIMSMAGGWFFLTVCEAFTLGNREYRLPGVGAYMAVAIEKGDTRAMVWGVVAMAIIIITMDLVIWRPALAWVHRFRLEQTLTGGEDRLINFIYNNSLFLRFMRNLFVKMSRRSLLKTESRRIQFKIPVPILRGAFLSDWLRWPAAVVMLTAIIWGGSGLLKILGSLPLADWGRIMADTMITFGRVAAAVVLSTIWALPAGVWLSRKEIRLRIAQPIAQLLASFPAPMLYPLVLGLTFKLKIDFSVGSMILMLLGVQWYILFNTLAGGLRISREIQDSMTLMGSSRKDLWRYLYIPSVFPALVTGWVTAAGGAWNASIVAEYINYQGATLETRGLGALISRSASKGDFAMLSACLVVMVIFVVLLNRYFWDRIYTISQKRFRLDF
jgi:NitT/TauT family transport system permease protein